MTTVIAMRNVAVGGAVPPPPGLPGAFCLRRYGIVGGFVGRRVKLRGLPRSSPPVPCLIGESDDFESRNRLNWWSYGAFARKGQLEGNQYLAGRRAPPLLHP
jgi:hypothetical protein